MYGNKKTWSPFTSYPSLGCFFLTLGIHKRMNEINFKHVTVRIEPYQSINANKFLWDLSIYWCVCLFNYLLLQQVKRLLRLSFFPRRKYSLQKYHLFAFTITNVIKGVQALLEGVQSSEHSELSLNWSAKLKEIGYNVFEKRE